MFTAALWIPSIKQQNDPFFANIIKDVSRTQTIPRPAPFANTQFAELLNQLLLE